jgi:hypothetical protein
MDNRKRERYAGSIKGNGLCGMKKYSPEILDNLFGALDRVRFGEISITIHDSRIVQIETKEKKRFK